MAKSSCFFFACGTPTLVLSARTLFAFGLLLAVTAFSAVAQETRESLSNETAQSLAEKWEIQRRDLSLVEISYRSMRRKVPIGHNIARDKVRMLVQRLAKNSNTKTLAEVGVALDPRLAGLQPAWANGTFLMDGKSILSELSAPGRADVLLSVVRHLGYELHVRNTMKDRIQVDVMREQEKLRFRPQGLNGFVVMPASSFLSDAEISIVQGNEKGGLVSISTKSVELLVSSETGFVHEGSRGKYDKGHYHETLQFNPKQHGTTIVMPELFFQGRYFGNTLSSFSLSLIDKVTTSQNAITKSFHVGVLPSDVVIDHTGDTREMVKFSHPTDDVIAGLFDPGLRRLSLERSR